MHTLRIWRCSGRLVLLPLPAVLSAFMCAEQNPGSGRDWPPATARRCDEPGARSGGDAVNISVAERAAAEAYLDRLTRNVRDLAERLEMLKVDLRVADSPDPPPGRRAVSPGRRSRRGAP